MTLDDSPLEKMLEYEPLEHAVLDAAVTCRHVAGAPVLPPLQCSAMTMGLARGLRTEVGQSIRTCEERQLNIISDSSITNTNIYWRALNAKYSVKPRPKILPLAHNRLIITDPTQKAQLFNDYFIEQTTLNDEHL